MSSLKEASGAEWIKNDSWVKIEDESGPRNFIYLTGEGRERQPDEKLEHEFQSESLSLNGKNAPIMLLIRKHFPKEQRTTYTIRLFVTPDNGKVKKNSKALTIVEYDESGKRTNKPNFKFGFGSSDQIPGYQNDGHLTASECPGQIDFQKTMDAFLEQSKNRQYHNPVLFKIPGRFDKILGKIPHFKS